MDLLASLGLENALPEQSTRLTHSGVIAALEKHSSECQLGFNCCLTCGTSLRKSNCNDGGGKSSKQKVIKCKGCNRVKYCSENCRQVDAEPQQLADGGSDDVDEGALGHSPVICS